VDQTRFDALAKAFAGGLSRRQVLKGFLSLTVGTIFAGIGITRRNSYAADSPLQGEPSLFLPAVMKFCEVASRYGKPQYCEDALGCRCIESAEGEIRCGLPPSDCTKSVLCSSSEDCAELGPGFFCDVPNSGGCTDPPRHLSRCIGPCELTCPEEKQCGSKCCTDQQTCVGETCVGSYNCTLEYVTLKSMQESLAALAAGETSADISSLGCIKAHQQLQDDVVTYKSYTVGNRTVMRWRRVNNQWIGESDADQDDFFEWRSVTTYGESAEDFETIETNYSPETQQPIFRTTSKPDGTDIHVIVEETNQAGNFVVVSSYTTPNMQAVTHSGVLAAANPEASAPSQTCDANPCDIQKVRQRLELGVERASNCFSQFGDRGVEFYLRTYDVLSRNMTIKCEPIPGPPQAAIGNWADPNATLVLIVDPEKYCQLNDEQQEWILYHEVLHAALQKGHDPQEEALPEEHRKQIDRVYGCMAMCYNNQAAPTKCMCARCFNVLTCDPICAAFNSDCGATCNCGAAKDKYAATCADCLEICPSGLGCFGFQTCDPVGHSPICMPQPTCP
jgi:hypothetical protein